jgi:hypothetical protein
MLHFANTPTIRLVPLHFPPSLRLLFAGFAGIPGTFNATRRLMCTVINSYRSFLSRKWFRTFLVLPSSDNNFMLRSPSLAHMFCWSGEQANSCHLLGDMLTVIMPPQCSCNPPTSLKQHSYVIISQIAGRNKNYSYTEGLQPVFTCAPFMCPALHWGLSDNFILAV